MAAKYYCVFEESIMECLKQTHRKKETEAIYNEQRRTIKIL